MPDDLDDYDFHTTWTSGGKRYGYGIDCDCPPGAGHEGCMGDCEDTFDADVVILKRLHPVDP